MNNLLRHEDIEMLERECVFLKYVCVKDVSYGTLGCTGGNRHTTVRWDSGGVCLIGSWFCVERFMGFEMLAGSAGDGTSRIGATVRFLWGMGFFVSCEMV
jgi:hypothetical protein